MRRILTIGLIGAALLAPAACTTAGAPAGESTQTATQPATEPSDSFRYKGLSRQQADWLRGSHTGPAGR